MDKRLFLLTLFLLVESLFVSGDTAGAAYHFTVQPNGETIAVISEITEETSFSIPLDVLTPDIDSGKYTSTEHGITVIPEQQKQAQLRYTSSQHTKKEDGIWYFEADVANGSTVEIALPSLAKVVQARPRPIITRDAALTMRWDTIDTISEKIMFSYVFIGGDEDVSSNRLFQWLFIFSGGGAGIIIIILLIWGYSKKRKMTVSHPTSPPHDQAPLENKDNDIAISDGQMNLLRAANENEALILRILLRHQGHIKRNTLEKETELSKSSLASSLSNLEKKGIIAIDRTFHVHYITLTKWFKSL